MFRYSNAKWYIVNALLCAPLACSDDDMPFELTRVDAGSDISQGNRDAGADNTATTDIYTSVDSPESSSGEDSSASSDPSASSTTATTATATTAGSGSTSASGDEGTSSTDASSDVEAPSLSLKLEAPTQYPARLPEPIVARLTLVNTSSTDARNLAYAIPAAGMVGNDTGVEITVDPEGAGEDCRNIPAGESCIFTATIGAFANPGSFTVTATPNSPNLTQLNSGLHLQFLQQGSISVTAMLGLVDIPETGADFYILPSDQTVLGSASQTTHVMLSVLTREGVEAFDNLLLVDETGAPLTADVVSALDTGVYAVNTFALTIPAGRTLQHVQVKSQLGSAAACNTLNDGSNDESACSNDALVKLVLAGGAGAGILQVSPNRFALNNNYSAQTVTLRNTGNVQLSELDIPTFSAPLSVPQNTCDTTLQVDEECHLVVEYSGSDSGEATITLSYNNGSSTLSTDLVVPYSCSGSPCEQGNTETPDSGTTESESSTTQASSGTSTSETSDSGTPTTEAPDGTVTPDAGTTDEDASNPTFDDVLDASATTTSAALSTTTASTTTTTSTTTTASTIDTVGDAGLNDAGDASTVFDASVSLDASVSDASMSFDAAVSSEGADAASSAGLTSDLSTEVSSEAGVSLDAGSPATGDSEAIVGCDQNPCDVNASCSDTSTGHRCICLPGFEGDGVTCGQSCRLTATCVCGDSNIEGTEVCDDGNEIAGDGCRADCRGNEECGDGIVDSLTGEQCDDGNEVDSDACRNDCTLVAFVDRAAVLVSDVLSCTTATQNTGRKTTTDGAGRLYVLMNCDGSLYVARSADQGATWSLPMNTTLTDALEGAIEGGADGFAYVVAINSDAELIFSRTLDAGATWETPRTLATGVSLDYSAQVSIDASGNAVFIAISTSMGNVRLLRNFALGTGAFQAVNVAVSNIYHEVAVDKISGKVIVMTDDPDFYIRISSDQGSTFSASATPNGLAYYTDWTASNGNIYVAGMGSLEDNSASFYVISASAPGTNTQITGLEDSAQARSIDTDALGNAYVASVLSSGVQLDRLLLNATTVNSLDAVPISATGEYPSVAALPNNSGALVAYADANGHVYAAIEAY